ncbi:hypothetical protein DV736_g3193, partial [Chaetothyriales sp. CBS 134916]
MPSNLSTPPASAASPLAPASRDLMSIALPPARHHPLRPGSQKESSLINYLDDRMLRIQRRYGKKFPESEQAHDDAPGYTSIDQVVGDIDPLLDLAWTSGTHQSTVTMTEKVRIKSLVADARVTVVNVVSGSGYTATTQDELSDEEDDTSEGETLVSTAATAGHDNIDSNIGRVFQKTLEVLGDGLA